MSKTRRALFVAALCVTPIMALTTANTAFAVPTVSSASGALASGSNWTVTAVAGGYEVTLKLSEKLPIVNDAPTLLVDGELLGLARESSDGLSLSILSSDPSVLSASAVTKGWSSGNADKAEESSDVSQTPSSAADVKLQKRMTAAAKAETLDAESVAEPSDLGSYTVTEAEYDFGNQAIPLAGIGGIRGEMTGKMYLTDAPGARPTVILLHGRHTSCSTGTANPLRWPCGDNQVNVRSYLGYQGTARALASNGYNVLSIAANAINSNDNQLALDNGAQARGQLILDTLTMLKKASAGGAVSYDDAQTAKTLTLDDAFAKAVTRADQPAAASTVTAASLSGRFDLTHVGVMGHSRGGEGVTSAATLNQALSAPFGIEAVLPLAPVDFGRMTVPDVPMAVFLPYCDGDVSNQQGQHMIDDSRNAFDDNVLRSAVWVMGADHNFFNTVWTPGQYTWATGDDWSTSDRTSTCATNSPTRLTAAQQYQVGVSYMTGFFRYTMGHEAQFAYLFDGSVKPSTTSTASFADVRIMASQPHDKTAMITDFTTENSLTRTYGTGTTAAVCTNLTGRTLPQSLPYCATTKGSSQVPHWTPASNGPNVPATPVTKLMWTTAAGELRVTVPAAKRNVSGYSQLTLKTAPEESIPTGTDFTISVVDGKNQSYSVLASSVNPLAVNRMPGGTNATLNKVVLQQLTIPTSSITGVDLTDVREVRIKAAVGADATANGGVYLSDLAFDTPGLGTAVVATRTAVNVGGTSVEEGAGPGTLDIPVSLTRADKNTVVAYVSVVGTATGKVGLGMEKVSFAPGETCKVVTVSTLGDSLASATPTSLFKVAATNTQNAVMGSSAFVNVSVREDDGVTGTAVAAPAVGVQGDVCAEAVAAKVTGALQLSTPTVAPGGSLTATAAGYRVGESVAFTLTDGTVIDTVIADTTGTATSTTTLADTTTRGTTTLTALGAGSKYVTASELKVQSPTSTSLSINPEVPAIKEAVTLTATVAGTDTTGDVTFTDAGVDLDTVPVTDGVATLTLDAGLLSGDHSITATFAENSTATASTSEAIAFTLTKGVPTLSMTVSAPTHKFGTPATATATVEGTTAGTVHFTYGAISTDVAITEGKATLELPATLTVGKYTITAGLLETDSTEASTIATSDYTVTKATTSIVANFNTKSVKAGKSVKTVITLRGVTAGTYPTGTIRIYTGTKVAKLVTITAANKGKLTATFTTPKKKGTTTVTIKYFGNTNFAGSNTTKTSIKLK